MLVLDTSFPSVGEPGRQSGWQTGPGTGYGFAEAVELQVLFR